jgi:ATP-binding cassette subfamily B protein
MLYVSKLAIDGVVKLAGGSDSGGDPRQVYLLILVLIGLWIIHSLTSNLQTALSSLLQAKVEQKAQISVMRKCGQFDIAFFEKPACLNMLENAAMGSQGQIMTVTALLFSMIETVISLLSFAIIFLGLHWIALVAIVVTTMPQIFSNRYFARKRWQITTGLAENRRMGRFYSSLVTERGPAKEIRLFGLFGTFLGRYISLAKEIIHFERILSKKQAWVGMLISLVSIAGQSFVWLFIINRAVTGAISVGDIILFTGALANLQGSFMTLFALAGQMLQNVLFLGNFFKLIDLDPTTIEGSLSRNGGNGKPARSRLATSKLQIGIEFRNVSFKYPGTDRFILRNVSFRLEPNESIAIVGQNGAGKTTLIKLLLRLYDTTHGEILLNGRDIRQYQLDELHRMFGVVFQDYVCYPLSVQDNIGFGRVDQATDLPLIQAASRKSGSHDFIDKLPYKYGTYLGRRFHNSGIDISTGQWQRIALARSLMRKDSPVLILDEPTASLDVYSEHEIYKQFSEMIENRLSIVVSHRFSTVRMANRILVFDGGHLVEEGTHEALVGQDTLYKEMYNLQAERYKT